MMSMSIGHCITLRHSALSMTASLSQTLVDDDCDLQTSTLVLSPHTRTCLGDRSFLVAGPQLWNSLPVELRQPHVEIEQFRPLLTLFLFERYCGGAWRLLFVCVRGQRIYLT